MPTVSLNQLADSEFGGLGHDGTAAPLYKGLPTVPAGLREPADVISAGFMWPMAVIHEPAVRSNAALMAEVCEHYGVQHAPHLKTAMSPQLAQLQAASGAWGFTVGSASQVRTARAWGCQRLVLAAESVDAQFLRWVRAELDNDPRFEFYLFVDSDVGVQLAAHHLVDVGRRAAMLVEVGHPGGRTGVRTIDAACALAETVRQTGLSLAGVAGYEGTVGAERSPEVSAAVLGYIRQIRHVAEQLAHCGLLDEDREDFIVSCGGSTFFDVVAEELSLAWSLSRPVTTVLRSGCYLLHDHEFYAAGAPNFSWGPRRLQPALEVWAQVISRPEDRLAILNAGRRDIGFDLGLPMPLRVIDPASGAQRAAAGTIGELNDQHAYLILPDGHALSVGDVVALGLSHPCTTMDKWRAVPVVDSQARVVDYVRTYF
ncbi:alanine racemase [Mycolicibacterium sp. S2-37]|uniref:alanine racemase n=1 Tax=Mycolicibacterium sp. S2-37 TaxID=2810297 RepID=UPI001A946DFE|nr:alanine racemase [Mycolicibacterium sp. S2-37]MBO0680443.1 alanine racemase [Mycolicibacterium sp. S2-37]